MPPPNSQLYHPDYSRLTVYLAGCDGQRISLTFTQLEQIVLGLLPYGARRQGSWWSNTATNRGRQNRAWLIAGWRVACFERDAETVIFERLDSDA
jgi:hypothetical protein